MAEVYKPKVRFPTSFVSVSRSGSVTDWLERWESSASSSGWDEKAKLNYFGQYLDGAIASWYRRYRKDNASIKWDDLKISFKKRCLVDSPALLPDRALHNRVFNVEKETPSDYFEDKLRLCYEVDIDMSDARVIQLIVDGLPVGAQSHIESRTDITLDNMHEVLCKFFRRHADSPVVAHVNSQIPSVPAGMIQISSSELRGIVEDVLDSKLTALGLAAGGGMTSPSTSGTRAKDRLGQVKCQWCGRPSHTAQQCYTLQNSLQNCRSSQDTNNNQYRGRGRARSYNQRGRYSTRYFSGNNSARNVSSTPAQFDGNTRPGNGNNHSFVQEN